MPLAVHSLNAVRSFAFTTFDAKEKVGLFVQAARLSARDESGRVGGRVDAEHG